MPYRHTPDPAKAVAYDYHKWEQSRLNGDHPDHQSRNRQVLGRCLAELLEEECEGSWRKLYDYLAYNLPSTYPKRLSKECVETAIALHKISTIRNKFNKKKD